MKKLLNGLVHLDRKTLIVYNTDNMASIFTKIIQGEIPCYKIAEDNYYLAFLDINPLSEGHTLVIPKREEDYLFALGDGELADLMVFAKKVALAIDSVVPCQRVGVAVLGLEVPHAHIHLIPMDSESDVHFSNPKIKFSPEEFIEIAELIKGSL